MIESMLLFVFVFAGLLVLAAFLTPVLYVRVTRLTRRLSEIEERLDALETSRRRAGATSGADAWRRGIATSASLDGSVARGDNVAAAKSASVPTPPDMVTGAGDVPPGQRAAAGPVAASVPPAEPGVGAAGPADRAVPAYAMAARDRDRAPDATETSSLEELIGTRMYVWMGALALFLAGAFLVKYGVDRGWITPTVRVSLAVFLGTALVMTAERIRAAAERACAGLSAAGVGVLYAAFYAATSVYALIPPWAGFVMLALTSLTAVGLSLRHGVIVGVVGLIGGYLAPMLVGGSAAGSEPLLVLYLLLLFATVLAASRRGDWWPVAAGALVASLSWSLLIVAHATGSAAAWGGLLAVVSALGYIGHAPRPLPPSAESASAASAVFDALAMSGALVVVSSTVAMKDAMPWPWLYLSALGASAIALGGAREQREPLAWIAAAGSALALLVWSVGPAARAASPAAALVVVAALGSLYSLGAFVVMWAARVRWRWAALSGASAVTYFLVGYAQARVLGWSGAEQTVYWGAAAVALAAAVIAGAYAYARRASEDGNLNATVGALAAAATAFLALAVPLSFSRDWFAVAWSLQTAALVWIAYRTGFASIRWPAWPTAGLVAFDLLLPVFVPRATGPWPVVNWILLGYGVSIVAFACGAWYAHRAGDRRLSVALQWGSMVLALVMIALEIDHAFSETALARWHAAPFVAASTFGIAWMIYGLGLRRAWRRWPHQSLRLGGLAVIVLALTTVVAVTAMAANPLWTGAAVGATRLFNWLLYGYGLAAFLALLAAAELRDGDDRERGVATAAGGVGIGLVFLWVTLAVRQAFHGALLDEGAFSTAENYAYSLAWVLLGSALLVIGVETRSRLARWASLPVMLLAVSKVFLFDVAAIGDLFRVLSFLGLGLSLVALGWVYQRFVFGREAS